MRKWLLGLNVLLVVGVVWGSFWLFGSVHGAALGEIQASQGEGVDGLEPIEVPPATVRSTRSATEYALVYENTLFREDRRYTEPEQPGATTVSTVPDKLPNIGLRGIALWGSDVPKAYFEVEVRTEKVLGSRTIPTTSSEVKPFGVGEEVSEGWRVAAVEGMDVMLEKQGVLKTVTLGKPSEFDNLPKPRVAPPVPPSAIRTEAGSVIIRGEPPVPPRPTKRGAATAKVEPKEGAVVVTGRGDGERPPREMSLEELVESQRDETTSTKDQLEALEELKKLREYVEKRREAEGVREPRSR